MQISQPVTVYEVREELKQYKPLSRESIYTNIRALGIKPVGARQRPQLYPPDTAARILKRYGFAATKR